MISVDVGRAQGADRTMLYSRSLAFVGRGRRDCGGGRTESAETARRKPGTNGAFWKTDTFHTFSREAPLFEVM